MTIFELVQAKELATYYINANSNKIPYLGETLFPPKKQLGLDLSWIKGSKSLPVVLKPSAFDTRATMRDRVGFEKIDKDMPFFKESMMINEKDRQDLNNVTMSGNQSYIDIIINKIFDDKTTLLDGARATRERMRMQILSTGRIDFFANGVIYEGDYHMKAEHKGNASVAWSSFDNAVPVKDILEWMDTVEENTGTRPTKAICTRKTWSYLLQNKGIKLDMSVVNGERIILTDTMLEQYLVSKLGLKVAVYSKKFKDETGATKNFYPDDTFTLLPDGNLGSTWFGTTPEESDLMSGSAANVSIVDTGVAITTMKREDPVNVETKVTMITLPSFERIDEIFIADVI